MSLVTNWRSLCGRQSRRTHSRYERAFADLPRGEHRVAIQLRVRRLFCDNARHERAIESWWIAPSDEQTQEGRQAVVHTRRDKQLSGSQGRSPEPCPRHGREPVDRRGYGRSDPI
ncbi:MAG: transposase family protein [Acetobacteraceae bacterium]|nr:transposase family protein [Acetobacteraceae bacterium]